MSTVCSDLFLERTEVVSLFSRHCSESERYCGEVEGFVLAIGVLGDISGMVCDEVELGGCIDAWALECFGRNDISLRRSVFHTHTSIYLSIYLYIYIYNHTHMFV